VRLLLVRAGARAGLLCRGQATGWPLIRKIADWLYEVLMAIAAIAQGILHPGESPFEGATVLKETPPPISINFGLFGVRIIRPSTVSLWLGPMLERSYVISEGNSTVNVSLGDNQTTTAHLQGLDAAGQPGTFTNPPGWTVDDSSIVTITPSSDGISCGIASTIPAKLGTATITVVDNDNPNVTPLSIVVTVSGEAVNTLTATIDTPVDRPPATQAPRR
jgi:hypothetical protein